MGTAYAHNLAKMPGVTVTGVVDINAGRAEQAAALTGAKAYTDVESLFEQKIWKRLRCVCPLISINRLC